MNVFEDVVIPMMGMMLVFGIPIIAILVKHQQKMALILRQPVQQEFNGAEVQQLRQEVGELRALMNQQLIATDRLEGMVRALPANTESIRERLS